MHPTAIEYNGKRYTLFGNYYRARHVFLHRDIYQNTYGNIPHGWHVHHLDGDPFNNDIENLQAMYGKEHISMHQMGHGRRPVAALAALEDWRVSDEGKAYMSEQGKRNAHYMLAPKEYQCEQCGKDFTRRGAGNTRFCSNVCKSKWRRASGLDNVVRQCLACGEDFTINRYKKTMTCSRICGQKLRRSTVIKYNPPKII